MPKFGRKRNLENTTYVQVYKKDLKIIETFMAKYNIKYRRDGFRVAIEYANSHGALS